MSGSPGGTAPPWLMSGKVDGKKNKKKAQLGGSLSGKDTKVRMELEELSIGAKGKEKKKVRSRSPRRSF